MFRFIGSLWVLSLPVHAQFLDRLANPQVTVTLTHPPELGLSVQRVAVGATHGPCSRALLDAVIQDFLQNGVEVMERQHLDIILAEHQLNLSRFVDRDSAAQLGRILGPSALIFLSVSRCATENKHLYRDQKTDQGVARVYISRTNGYLRASLRVVDLATARIFTQKAIDADYGLQNEAYRGYPDFPSEHLVQDGLFKQAMGRIHRLFFSWNEQRNLYFFNDKKCNLKEAYQLVKIGHLGEAAQVSQENLEFCETAEVKPKHLSHAYYNVGMTHFFQNNFDTAIDYFQKAYRVKAGNIIEETIQECLRAKQLAEEMQAVEERLELEESWAENAQAEPPRAEAEPQAEADPLITIEDRLRKLEALYKKGLITKEEYDRKRAEILKEL